MEFRRLGQTDLEVSEICLGTMTWGEQNSEQEAHAQLDYAINCGINMIDTAEMYPVPPRAETYTRTEQYLGSWLAQRGRRSDLVLATKIAGPTRVGDDMNYIRGGSRFTREQIHAACNASLQRLGTDYIDLYQLHWPERSTNFFGRLGVNKLSDKEDAITLQESLAALDELVKAGKVRHIGLSNESPWGVMHALRLADEQGLPRIASVQNPYSLLNRSYEIGLAEISLREEVSLLAYSPLAFGLLSGKYRHGAKPADARLTLFDRFQRYNKPQAIVAVERYAKVAEDAGISMAQMALAYVNSRSFVTSNIIGATTIDQLVENIGSATVELSSDTIAAIDAVHEEISNPCP
ncbi:NADP(H)-dependent aldo-keto reductase [Suttonella sp. R2A3]|uniref:NADP(H)-dependent aldo-keto reductase n=1 Tax=Suttonella sp. R2A3 TaxID=2908648 RepID=UPI001F45288A|nr:NADP(H)-dependent aldo-keto reductase [Suttonella sp. R2A3]UJF25087.1 NADP(H)-dependent aldo-keto reductase [Suttonella sp. R2A3]